MAGLVLDLRDQDGLAAQRRGAGDPVALRLHPDDLAVRVLRDLPDQGLAIGRRHPVVRLDLVLGRDSLFEPGEQLSFLARVPRVAVVERAPTTVRRVVVLLVESLRVHAPNVTSGRRFGNGVSHTVVSATA